MKIRRDYSAKSSERLTDGYARISNHSRVDLSSDYINSIVGKRDAEFGYQCQNSHHDRRVFENEQNVRYIIKTTSKKPTEKYRNKNLLVGMNMTRMRETPDRAMLIE